MKKVFLFLIAFLSTLSIIGFITAKLDKSNSYIYSYSYDNFPDKIRFKVNLGELDNVKEKIIYEGYNTKVKLKQISQNDKNIFITFDNDINWKLFSGECLSRIIVINNSSKNVLSTNKDINETIYYENGEQVPYRISSGPKNKITFIFSKSVVNNNIINIDFTGYKICRYKLNLKK